MGRFFSFRPGLDYRGRKFMGLRGFSGKPLHPPLTDVTVGAYVIGPILDIVAFIFGGSEWASDVYRAGGYVLILGAITSLATTFTGFFDWLATTPGSQMRRMVNAHAWTMIAMCLFVIANLAVRYLGVVSGSGDPNLVIALLSLIILGLVTLGGTLGGTLTYDWGFNVQTAKDSPVYYPSSEDIVSPHDAS